MRPPPLEFSEPPAYTTPFYEDPWPEDEEDEFDHTGRPFYPPGSSARSSRTSSSNSRVLHESAFVGADGQYLVDPYLGKEDIARLCAGYLIKTFHSQAETSSSKRLGQPTLPIFIAQLIYLTGAPYNAVLATLILLQRFRAKLSSSHSGGLSGHMLWLSAFIIACREESMQGAVKNATSAAYWSNLTLYSEREVDEMYRELWDELDGNVIVFPSYASALEKIKNPLASSTSSFGWPEGPLWTFEDDEDEEDEEENAHSVSKLERSRSCSEKVVRSTSPSKSVPKSRSDPKPWVRSNNSADAAAVINASSPASSRIRGRAVSSRLVSFFKRKAQA